MSFDEDVAVKRLDQALPAEVAFDAAAWQLPDAFDDRRGAGVGDPRLERFGSFLVQVGLPQLLAVEREFEHRAVRPGREELVAVGGRKRTRAGPPIVGPSSAPSPPTSRPSQRLATLPLSLLLAESETADRSVFELIFPVVIKSA